MSFVSYAQNREDVLLRRALREVHKGFYVDVGAADPIVESVTKSFYESGWHGINIEPVAAFYEKLVADRPRDLNLRCAIGESEGSQEFYEVPGTGLSTLDHFLAEQAAKRGFPVETQTVRVAPLTKILDDASVQEIHFLKVDVEGAEREVLASLDLQRWRPWIVVVEAIAPMGSLAESWPVPTHEQWEHLLLAADYDFAIFDGLNRFYVAREHAELGERLAFPVCVMDDYVVYDRERLAAEESLREQLRSAREEALAARSTIADLECALASMAKEQREEALAARSTIADLERELLAARTELRDVERRHREEESARAAESKWLSEALAYEREALGAVLSSTSWKITTPVRWTKDTVVRPLLRRKRFGSVPSSPVSSVASTRTDDGDDAQVALREQDERIQELVELLEWHSRNRPTIGGGGRRSSSKVAS